MYQMKDPWNKPGKKYQISKKAIEVFKERIKEETPQSLLSQLQADRYITMDSGEHVNMTEITGHKFSDNLVNELFRCSPAERRYIFGKKGGFKYFFLYHYGEYFAYKPADFHYDMYEDLNFDTQNVIWCMFRESAKSSIAKAYIVYCICHSKHRFINFDSYDKKSAEAALFDIAITLQTNPTILEDYGELFRETTKESSTKKSIPEFITSNKIKVKAYSIRESARGRIFGKYRPSLVIFDDIENERTVSSEIMTERVLKHFKEFQAGLASYANILILCNKISNTAAVAQIMDYAREQKNWSIREVPVYTGEAYSGEIMWPAKYAWTDVETAIFNSTQNNRYKYKISIESKRRELTMKGDDRFSPEMLLKPLDKFGTYFTIPESIKPRPPLFDYKDWRVYTQFIPGHRYALGADTAKGVGEDSSTAVVFDFTNNEVVAVYDNNRISPDEFSYELAIVGKLYGNCLIACEQNLAGWATLTKLKDIYYNLYTRQDESEWKDKDTRKLGFDTTAQTKPLILSRLRAGIQFENIKINDEKLYRELSGFTKHHTRKTILGTTSHFDIVMAFAIVYYMDEFAMPSAKKDPTERLQEVPFDKFEIL